METKTAQSGITELQGKYLQKFVGNWKIESKDSPMEYVTIKPLKNDLGVEVYAKWITTENMIILEAYGFWGYDREMDKIDISMFLSDGNTIHCLGSFKSGNELEFDEWSKTEPDLLIRTYHILMNSDDNLYEIVTSLSDNLKEEYHWTRIN